MIRIYNTLTKKKEIFNTLEKGKIKIYVCGPTVYDSCHIGHARSAVIFDVIIRYLKMIGFKVKYVRNFTDIDDKIIKRAKQLGIKHSELSKKYIKEFHRDMNILNVNHADVEPKVTDHIEDIISNIEKLVKNNFAYVINGDVYFSVNSAKFYGKLSGRSISNMLCENRVLSNKNKISQLDFALWKCAKIGEPSWQSPWGLGRPGWHIECSVMSGKFLGKTLDIHGGGEDLIFPHHENEMVQSESINGVPFARYWLHNGLVNIDNKKMSKSLGNLRTIKDIVKTYNPEAIRLFLLSSHYRSQINFSEKSIKSLQKAFERTCKIFRKVHIFEKIVLKNNSSGDLLWSKFANAMNDDFNTAKGIGIFFNGIKELNHMVDSLTNKNDKKFFILASDIFKIGKVLGIFSSFFKKYLLKNNNYDEKDNIYIDKIVNLINEREKARIEKNWVKADKIRNKLINMNIKLEDKPTGTAWKIVK